MTKLQEDTLLALWESIDVVPGRFVKEEDFKLTGSVMDIDLEYASEAPVTFIMKVRGTIEPINKKEEEVMEGRLYKFSEFIQMLEEGELPEGTEVLRQGNGKGFKYVVEDGPFGLVITETSTDAYPSLSSSLIHDDYTFNKPSPKRYKALHKVFTDHSVKPFRLFQRTDGSITLLSSFLDNGNKNTFTMEELKAFPINLNDFNLEEVSTTV